MRLRQKFDAAKGNLDQAFTTDERWLWHAYDYGWRAVTLGDTRLVSPIDPLGKWYDADLAKEAEQFFRSRRASKSSAENPKFAEARLAREAWAREHGCPSFEIAMTRGFANVANGSAAAPGYQARPAPNQSSLASAARAAMRITDLQPRTDDPALIEQAKARVGL